MWWMAASRPRASRQVRRPGGACWRTAAAARRWRRRPEGSLLALAPLFCRWRLPACAWMGGSCRVLCWSPLRAAPLAHATPCLPRPAGLTRLELSYCGEGGLPQVPASVAACTALRSLVLNGAALDSDAALAGLAACTTLEVRAWGCQLQWRWRAVSGASSSGGGSRQVQERRRVV